MYNITTFKNVLQYQTANPTMQNHNYFCTSLIIPTTGKENHSKTTPSNGDLNISKNIKIVIITELHMKLQ